MLPLRDTVLFPNSFMPLAVAREASVRLIDEATTAGRMIGVFTQREASVEEPVQDDLYPIGTATHIHKMFKLPDGSLRLIVQGLARIRLDRIVQTRPYLRAAVTAADEQLRDEDHLEIDALQRNIKSNFQQVVSLSPLLSDDLQALAANITDPGKLADFIASSLATIGTPIKQEVLATLDIRARMDSLNRHPDQGARGPRARLEDPVAGAVRGRQEPARVLPARAAEGDPEGARRRRRAGQGDRGAAREDRRRRACPTRSRRRRCASSIGCRRCRSPPPSTRCRAPTSTGSSRCPGRSAPRTRSTCSRTKEVLDADHSGLEKVKDRVLEYLAVRKLNPDVKGPILCFLGPPGVGKTSLARSIANSLGRKFVRVSLGGMRDEAEIRGHRRTYIGALPGQVIQGLRRAESKNPVFILDEIDKLGSDFRGDPASALLEVLDPEQNNTFRDHYLDVPFDLSEVLFLTTANVLDPIPPALRDRMEVLELAGYTEEEKLQDRVRAPDRQAGRQPRPDRRARRVHRAGDPQRHPRLHPRGRRPQPRARDRRALPQGRPAPRRGGRSHGRHHAGRGRRDARRADVPRRGDREPHQGSRRRRRPGVDAGRRRGAVRRGVAHAGRRHPDADRPPRRRDEGVGADRAVVVPRARAALQRRSRPSTRTPRSTCTCRPARSRRTGRRPA